MLDDILIFKFVEIEKEGLEIERKGDFYINIDKLIIDFKSIIKQTGVEYSAILNYTFSILQTKTENILKRYKQVTPNYRCPEELISGLINLISFSFFVYTVSPQITTTTRICRILSEIIYFIKRNDFSYDLKDALYKDIFFNIELIFIKNKINKFSQLETINFLLISVELGKNYTFTDNSLLDYFGINSNTKAVQDLQTLNYFSLTALLFYIRNKKQHHNLKKSVCEAILYKVRKAKEDILDLGDNTEFTLLIFDLLSCPYLEIRFKKQLLNLYKNNIGNIDNVVNYISSNKWFIDWGKL